MAGIVYYVCDSETSGLRINFHDVIELSIIRFDDRVQLSRTIKATNPRNASIDALKITNRTMKDLYKGDPKNQVIEEVNQFFNQDGLTSAHRCLVCHNAPFDRRFIHAMWESCNKNFPADLWLDTLAIGKKIAKTAGHLKQSMKLQAACDYFGIKKIPKAHNAKDDARNTYLLLKHFMDNNINILENIKRIPHGNEEDENTQMDESD